MGGRPHQPNDPSVMASVEAALTEVPRAGAIGTLWCWRYEAAAAAVIAAAVTSIVVELGAAWLGALAGAAAVAGVALLCSEPSRRRIIARAWCFITPHRIRVGCVQAWVQTRTGRLPAVLYTTPTALGERVLLWCPAGITARDLAAARDILTAACWAMDVRVIPSPRRTHLVTLEVIRREPAGPPADPAPGWPYLPGAGGAEGADPEEPAPARWEPAARSAR